MKENPSLRGDTPVFKHFFRGQDLIPTHSKVYIFRMLKDPKIMGKYFCSLELYCNLTPAELVGYLLFYARPGLLEKR